MRATPCATIRRNASAMMLPTEQGVAAQRAPTGLKRPLRFLPNVDELPPPALPADFLKDVIDVMDVFGRFAKYAQQTPGDIANPPRHRVVRRDRVPKKRETRNRRGRRSWTRLSARCRATSVSGCR